MNFKSVFIAVFFGFVIGFIAGLIGVGGGEFRIPVLIGLLGFPVFFATATNLIIGILVSLTSFLRRYSLMTANGFSIAILMSIFSLIGGYIGAVITGKAKERVVGYILIIFLFLIGVKLIASPFVDIAINGSGLNYLVKNFMLAVLALLIGVISGLFGVAGGEFRIPVLMYLLGLPIKLAGTISTLVALPTQVGGLWKHYHLKHVSKEGFLVAIIMGIASIFGSFAGAGLVFKINDKALEFSFGIILIVATYGIYKKLQARGE